MRENLKVENESLQCSPSATATSPKKKVAFLWDESFLWGLMAYKALKSALLPFDLIRSEEIKAGKLRDYAVLFVPGGWASNKLKTLGDDGTCAIKGFVEGGGKYLGFCGGAGLATLDGIGLLKVKRKPTRIRVPSFSGRINLSLAVSPVWRGIHEPVFQAWWPSQLVPEGTGIKILATYGEALPDSFSSDLNVGDTEKHGRWAELEGLYGINLDPRRMLDDPAVLEGSCGHGRVMLSLVHFDTPNDRDGSIVLRNIWEYLGGVRHRGAASDRAERKARRHMVDDDSACLVSELFRRCAELISLGTRNFLWFWRNPVILQWRRGVRGLEYCTLYTMMKEIEEIIQDRLRSPMEGDDAGADTPSIVPVRDRVMRIRDALVPFTEEAGRLLILEREAMHGGYITYEKCDNPAIREIRTRLFSDSKSHGGLFKRAIDEVDALLFTLLLH